MAQAFGLDLDTEAKITGWEAKIAGHRHTVYLSESHFSEVNILGDDFCSWVGCNPQVVAGRRKVTYYVGPWAR